MYSESTDNQIAEYVTRMAQSEKEQLIDILRKKYLHDRAKALDSKGKKIKKGTKISMDEIAAMVRKIRKENAARRGSLY